MAATAWSPELAAVRRVVFERLAATGAAPSPGEIAAELGLERRTVLARLHMLHELHQLVLGPGGDAIRMAHPFTNAPMNFVLRDGDELWWGGCAWDSFGIAAALGRELEVLTRCPASGEELRFRTGPGLPPPGALAVRLPRPAAEWWDDVVATCTHIRLFASAAAAEGFAAGGAVVPAWRMWALAQPWYGDRLEPGYAPMAPERRQALLEQHGLTGDFWRLPA